MPTDGPAPTPTTGRTRRILAAILCPLGFGLCQLVNAWEPLARSSAFWATLWDYVGIGVVEAYLIATITGAIVWFIVACIDKRPRGWLIIPLFTATCSLVTMVLFKSLNGLFAGVMFGLPIAITYRLIAGPPPLPAGPQTRQEAG